MIHNKTDFRGSRLECLSRCGAVSVLEWSSCGVLDDREDEVDMGEDKSYIDGGSK